MEPTFPVVALVVVVQFVVVVAVVPLLLLAAASGRAWVSLPTTDRYTTSTTAILVYPTNHSSSRIRTYVRFSTSIFHFPRSTAVDDRINYLIDSSSMCKEIVNFFPQRSYSTPYPYKMHLEVTTTVYTR